VNPARRDEMKLHYYPETDSLYIELSERASMVSQELTSDIVLDFDENRELIGID
jgi:uncharacterized protein YuzE